MKDIEERLYIIGITFDKPDEEEIERQRENLEEPDKFTPRYLITYLSPIPSAQTEGGGEEETYSTRSITTVTPDEGSRQMATRIDKDLFFGHAKLVLFGEEILKDKKVVMEMLDYLHRNQKYNWNVLVGVVQGNAKDAFSINPKGIAELVPYITGIMQNRPETSKVADVTLSQLAADMGDDGTMALPKVIVAPDEIKVEGAAVIKDYTLLDYLSGVEGRATMFLKGTLEGGSVIVEYKNELIPYVIVNAGVKNELKTTEEGLQLSYAIETEGQLDEGIYGGDFVTDENIKDIEEQVEREIVEDCMRVIEKLQKELRVDVIYADSYIMKYHPKIWEQIEDDYSEYFQEMDIRVTADVKIRGAGVVK